MSLSGSIATSATVPLALQSNGGGGIVFLLFMLIALAVAVVTIAGMWKSFEKAGEPGWGVLVPIYNSYLVIKIGGRPWWWLLLWAIPLIGVVFVVINYIDFAKSFGKGAGFGLGLAFLSFVFFPMLGFGDAQYQGPAAA